MEDDSPKRHVEKEGREQMDHLKYIQYIYIYIVVLYSRAFLPSFIHCQQLFYSLDDDDDDGGQPFCVMMGG